MCMQSLLFVCNISLLPANWTRPFLSFDILLPPVGRFFSGPIFVHPALAQYDYYLRVDDDSNFLCEIDYDIFKFMRNHRYKYGWLMYFLELPAIAGDTLWVAAVEVVSLLSVITVPICMHDFAFPVASFQYANRYGVTNQEFLNDLVTDHLESTFRRCHYWNNFEVVDLNFFRSEAYQSYFNFLDRQVGFYHFRCKHVENHTMSSFSHLFIVSTELLDEGI